MFSKRVSVMADLIVVLDVDSTSEALRIVEQCEGCAWFKVGAQLFTREGPDMVRRLVEMGRRVMLDLKFHDIPNTVSAAARAAADLGASLATLHATGGKRMIAAAREAVEGTPLRLLAVTVLTSLTAEELHDEVGVRETPAEAVSRLARQSVEAGAHGIVCSPREAAMVRQVVGPDALVVTPGVRPTWAETGDQRRVMTPREAVEAGASMIVVGRPILDHPNPAEAVRMILREMNGAS